MFTTSCSINCKDGSKTATCPTGSATGVATEAERRPGIQSCFGSVQHFENGR